MPDNEDKRSDRLPVAHWPWQRSLQNRILFAYGAALLAVLGLLMVWVGQIVYNAQLEEVEHSLELDAFLAANALEDPLSGYAAEFAEYKRWEAEREHDRAVENGDHTDEQEYQEDGEGDGEEAYRSAGAPSARSGGAFSASSPGSATQVAERLQRVAALYASDIGARVTILESRGHVVADSQYVITQVPNQFDQIEVQAAFQGKEQHDVRIDPFTGELTLYAAAPIQQGGTSLGVLQLSQPMADITEKIRRVLLSLTLAGIAALVVASALGVWIGHRLVRPVRELEAAAMMVAGGDLSHKVPIESADELGALARAFNHMVDELQRMIEQQRLFVANASHELRTPLANIKLRSEALLNGGQDDPAVARRYLAEIDSEADRLGRLANTLLDLSRLDNRTQEVTLPEQAVDIRPVLRSVCDVLAPRVRDAGVTLETDIAEALPSLLVWPDHLEAILVNLLDNAVKYTPAGGVVRMTARSANGYCQIRVEDTGPGIPPADLPYIFERFYRVSKARSRRMGATSVGGGAGLGLSIVKSLVDQNGGRIHVVSRSNTGTVFVVEFPVPRRAL